MDRFSVDVREHAPARFVVAISGELDLPEGDGFLARLAPLISPGALVVLDASDLVFMDSTGLRILLHAVARAADEGARFRLAAPQPAVRRVFELSGTEDLIEIYDDMSAALAG
ncbi:MAG TPA: STAS domain-containing protein [Actinocrinis sp.]|nr:STAS domain-containing protein [Actinocrinis sp.]